MFSNVPTTVVNALAVLGLFLALPLAYRFASFIWIYFIRSSSINRYLTGPAPYALITGASDGIGKGVAKELYSRGFNLILHGRNEEKTRKVVEEIKASGGGKDVRYFLADATSPTINFEKIVSEVKDCNITLVFNNVGGTPVKPIRIDQWSEDEVLGIVRWNALFPLGLTRALLPQLRKSHSPVLVMSVGSYAGDLPPPRLALYAASKRFMEFLSRGLAMDEHYWSPSDVQFMYLVVGQVSTNAMRRDVSFVCPDATTFARAVVDRVGCGQRRIAPYLGHAITQWSVDAMPAGIGEMIVAQATKQMFFSDNKKGD